MSGLWHSVRFWVISNASSTSSLSKSCPRSMTWPPSLQSAVSAESGLALASQSKYPPNPGVMTPPLPGPSVEIVGRDV